MAKEFYTMNEVCELFGIARCTLNRYMNEGKIGYFKTGTSRSCKVLFDRNHITKFLKKLGYPKTNITQLAKETGVSRVTIYTLKNKLGRVPTKEEVIKR